MWFEIYRDSWQQSPEPWRWRLMNGNDQVVAMSACGYCDAEACRMAIFDLRKVSPTIPVRMRRPSPV
jgi:uncharacterized protein YegP (UPF0339 family)